MKSTKAFRVIVFFLLSFASQAQNSLFNFPQNFQFYQRNSLSQAALNIHGTVGHNQYDGIKLMVQQNGEPILNQRLDLNNSTEFEWNVDLDAGLFEYDFEIWLFSGGDSSSLAKATKVLCGDTFLIYGQSNAVASCCFNEYRMLPPLKYLRSYLFVGEGDPNNGWRDLSIEFDWPGGMGAWLAKNIIENQKIPVQIINGAKGGQALSALAERDATNPDNLNTNYGKFLRRITDSQEKQVSGFVFIQGEHEANSADDIKVRNYRDEFKKLLSHLKEDDVGFDQMYLVQTNIDKDFFANSSAGALREEQRKLKVDFPEMHLYSAFGHPRQNDGVHYTKQGYQGIANDLYKGIKQHIYRRKNGRSIEGPIVQKIVHDVMDKRIRVVFEKGQEVELANSIDYGNYQRNIREYIYDGHGNTFIDSVLASNREVELFYSNGFSGNSLTYLPSFFSDNFSLTYNGPLIKNQEGLTALSFQNVETCDALPKPVLGLYKLENGGVTFSVSPSSPCQNCHFEVSGRSGFEKRYAILDSFQAEIKDVFVGLSWAVNVGEVNLRIKSVSPVCESSYANISFIKCPKDLLYHKLSDEIESGGQSLEHETLGDDFSNIIYPRPSPKAYNPKAPSFQSKIGRCRN